MHSNLEDKILIQGLVEGNSKIFDYIFLHYYSVLVAYVIKQGIDLSSVSSQNPTPISFRIFLSNYG